MLGNSPGLQELKRRLRRIGPAEISVLITGESGSGKELVANALHEGSRRSQGEFVAVNCAALPADLVDGLLFGHVRGTFTGAEQDRVGLLEAAHRGTLFLDEIGDLSLAAQSKLLRALETRRVLRVGATREVPVDVRLVAATHRSLEEWVKDGRFRGDLFHRLAVVHLRVPPLRERLEDVPLLATRFVAEFAARHKRRVDGIAPAALDAMMAHGWPGNVRELRNVLEAAVVMTEGPLVDLDDLPAIFSTGDVGSVANQFTEARARAMREFDRNFLATALERHGGNIARTAASLGLHRQTLQKLLARRELRATRPDTGRGALSIPVAPAT
jgi:DNA-binding NtrC family response regulator